MYRLAWMKSVLVLFLCSVVLPLCAPSARADDEGEWASIGAEIADEVSGNLLVWIEGTLAEHNLMLAEPVLGESTRSTTRGEADPNAPAITIHLYIDAPFPASNKTVVIEIYADGRVKVTTTHHKILGDETEVEWRNDVLPDEAKRWLWGPPEEHDLRDDPIEDISNEDEALEKVIERVQPIVEDRVNRNIREMTIAVFNLLKYLWNLVVILP